MRKALILLALTGIIFCASAQKTDTFKRSKRQQRAVERSIEKLEKGAINGDIWGTVIYSENDAPWIMNHYLTFDELCAYADTHRCAQVRAVALWCLMESHPSKSKELFFRHITDGAHVSEIGGFCFPANYTVGDFLVAHAVRQSYLDSSDWHKVDSLLLGSPDAVNIDRRYDLLDNMLHPTDAELQTLRRVSAQCLDLGGLQVLARKQKLQDTALVLKAMDSIYNRIWTNRKFRKRYGNDVHPENQIVEVSHLWQHPAFDRRATQMCDSLTAQGIVPHETLLRFALCQNAQQFPALIERILARLASHPNNTVTASKPHGRLVAKAVEQISESIKLEDYSIKGVPILGCYAVLSYLPHDTACKAVEEILKQYK